MWLQEIPKGSGRWYLYRYDPDTGKSEYVGKAHPSQIQEHRFEKIMEDKFGDVGENEEMVKSIWGSMMSRSDEIEDAIGKDFGITQRNVNSIILRIEDKKFNVQFGGSAFFRQDKKGNWLAFADATKKIDPKKKEVYVTYSKGFFTLPQQEQDVINEEIGTILRNRGLKQGDVDKQFDTDIGKKEKLWQGS
jgi:hypothetical protein